MKALIIICAVFLICFVCMLVATHNAMPYDPAWDDWEEGKNGTLKVMEKLRTCCGVEPIIVIENFRNTKYKMRKIKCPKCGMETQPKRFYADAVREWNSPEHVHLN